MDRKIAVVAIVENDGKVLLGKKTVSNHIFSGFWHIPGGKVHEGEKEGDVLIREMKEEAGIDIHVEKFMDEMFVPPSTIARWYLCSYVSGKIKAGDDIDEAKFIDRDQVINVCHPVVVEKWPTKVREYFGLKKA